jgi:hypothetical protein
MSAETVFWNYNSFCLVWPVGTRTQFGLETLRMETHCYNNMLCSMADDGYCCVLGMWYLLICITVANKYYF